MATSSNPPPHQNPHPHHHLLNSTPDPTPLRPRARKPTKAGPNGPKKQCLRGKGVAELERLIRQQQHQQIQSSPQQLVVAAANVQQQQQLLHQANPLAGVPVHPGRLAHFGLLAQRVGPTDLGYPDQHLQRCIDDMKKKRMVMGELGFMNGPSGIHLGGAYHDMNMFNNGDNSNNAYYLALNAGVSQPNHSGAGSEVVAIHKKGNGSTIVMMKEYEFFPDKSEIKEEDLKNLNLNLGFSTTTTTTTTPTTTNTNFATGYYNGSIINNDNTNYNTYYNTTVTPNPEVEDYMLNLQMCGIDPDHSSSSSLSSLSDPPPTTTGRLDLSLRL